MNYKFIIKTTISSAIFAFILISLVVLIANQTKNRILENEKLALIFELNQLVYDFDNDILAEAQTKEINLYGNLQKVIIYQAKKSGKHFAKLIKHTYPRGYSGNISILTAVDNQNKIIGVRILKHSETPGLGDKIEFKKSNWITSFNNLSLDDKIWKVKKRGGNFDSWSGATITPQAVINAVEKLLQALINGKL